jgi:hypothetical protein
LSFEGWIFFGVAYGRQAKGPEEDKVKLLRLSEGARATLAAVFDDEVDSFLDRDSKLYVDNPVYNCDLETEVFKIEGFRLPETFTDAVDEWQSHKDLSPEEMTPDRVKIIMGAKWTEDGLLTAFKKLNRSKILDRESKWFWWHNDTFDTADGPGFVLPEGLSAVHKDGDLYFERDRGVNAFLSLDAYFREATHDEVEQLIAASPLEWRGDKPIQNIVSKRCKRLMYMFMSQGGFDDNNISAPGIRDVAAEIGVSVSIEPRDGREILILPNSSGDVTRVFEILTHHYSPGIWDGLWRRYNSSELVPGQQASA